MVCTVYFWDNKVIIAREPWSGGYGKRLTFRRLWVWIQVPYTGWTFFSYICCKICNVCLKRPKISKKRRVSALFKKNKVIICLNCWGGKQTQNSFYIFLVTFFLCFLEFHFGHALNRKIKSKFTCQYWRASGWPDFGMKWTQCFIHCVILTMITSMEHYQENLPCIYELWVMASRYTVCLLNWLAKHVTSQVL